MESLGLVLASGADLREFLIPSTAADSEPASPQHAGSATAQKSAGLGQSLHVRVTCGPAQPSEDEQQPSPASTASAQGEARSPSHRHHPATAAATAAAATPTEWLPEPSYDSDPSSSSEADDTPAGGCIGCSGHEAAAQAHWGASDRRCSNASDAASSGSSMQPPSLQAAASLPECEAVEPPAGADSATTPAACQLSGSSSFGGSRGGTPQASSGRRSGLTPQQEVEVLEARLEEEAEARRTLQRRLEEQRCEAVRQRCELGAQYEQRLSELCRRLEATAAEAGSSAGGLRSSILAGSQQVTLSGSELEALRRQAAEQEMLLAALNTENELAAQRLQQQRAEQQHAAAAAAGRIEELQHALAAAAAERNERQSLGTPAVDAARLQELLALQGELQAARATVAEHEAELRRQAAQLEGSQLAVQQQAVELQASAARLQETQRQLADADGLMRQQARAIQQLEQQLVCEAAQRPAPAVQQALPPGLSNGGDDSCGSSGGGGGGGGQLAELQAKLARLQAALELKEQQHARALRALRAEHAHLRVDQGISAAASRGGAARVQQLEAQVVEVKEAAARRIRALEARLRQAQEPAAVAGGSAGGSGAGARAGPTSSQPQAAPRPSAQPTPRPTGRMAQLQEQLATGTAQLQQRDSRVRQLEGQLSKRDAELAALHKRCAAADEQLQAAAARQAAAEQAVQEVSAANDSLQQQLAQLPGLRQQLAALEREAVEQQQAALERVRAAEAAAAALEREASDSGAQHAAELERLERRHAVLQQEAERAAAAAAAAEWQPRLQAAAQEAGEARRQAEELDRALRAARAGLPWTPSAAEFAALERRLLECQRRVEERERHWAGVAAELRRTADAQQERLRLQYGAAQAAREQQLDAVRAQLEGLLAAARLLAEGRGSGGSG